MIDKKHCSGCRNNFYNGNNDIGVSECWSLKKAKLKRRFAIGSNTPTFQENFYEVMVPNCYHKNGTAYVDSLVGFPIKEKKDR